LNHLRMIYRTPTHDISNPLPMVYCTHYPRYFDPPTQMVYLPTCSWYIVPSTNGISNPLVWQKWMGVIYHDGVQNTKTKIWIRGQNSIRYIELGVDFSRVQNTTWHRLWWRLCC
jgi:hypothetical protein